MTYLLDTHVWIWAVEEPDKLGGRARSILKDLDNVRLLSAVSALEIARLIYFEKLHFSRPLSDWIHHSMRALVATAIDLYASSSGGGIFVTWRSTSRSGRSNSGRIGSAGLGDVTYC